MVDEIPSERARDVLDRLGSEADTDSGGNARSLDGASIVRAARHRRRPKIAVIAVASTAAAVGLGVVAVTGIDFLLPVTSSDSAVSGLSDGADGPAFDGPGVDEEESNEGESTGGRGLPSCGEPIVSRAPSPSGLVATPDFVESVDLSTDARDGGVRTIDGAITLENTGSSRVSGAVSAPPVVTLSRDGIVIAQTDSGQAVGVVEFDLSPGETISLDAALGLTECDGDGDTLGAGNDELAPIPPGRYDISATVDIVAVAATEVGGVGDGELGQGADGFVEGPTVPIVLD
ncbi:hypothetical protein [Marisediminicola sp. LYQ85]|uniref:hypothetical protein n=1 Tax=Marisediminicola sp. LYQ85 TaxID=3391062 RepID=UPI003983BF71